MKNMTLPYWGEINACISQGTTTLWIARQDVGIAPTLYRLDSSNEQPTLSTHALPVVMQNLCALTDSSVLLIADDGILYQTDWHVKKIKAFEQVNVLSALTPAPKKPPFAIAMTAFADKIAILYPHDLVLLSYQKHQVHNIITTVHFDEPASCLSVSADGAWLVIGEKSGQVNSYQVLENGVSLSSREPLHQGEVTAICFEPQGHQFFSAGSDKQLYRTHAHGTLHAIDRAKNSQHSDMVRTMCITEQRLYTGSDDKSVKSWQFDKGQPNTCKDDLVKIYALQPITYHGQASLLVVGTDQSLRIIPLDDEGKLQSVILTIKDGYQRLADGLTHTDDDVFKDSFALLQQQQDTQTLSLVFKFLTERNVKYAYRHEQLAQWFAEHTQKFGQLEKLLQESQVENVRKLVFERFTQLAKDGKLTNSTAYIHTALNSSFEDMNVLAVKAYGTLAQQQADKKPSIIKILQETLKYRLPLVRKHALVQLEQLFAEHDPKADLLALESNFNDIRQAGLIRLYQRGLLHLLEVKRKIMLLQAESDDVLRQTAFYINILTQPTLAQALKQHDAQFTRILQNFDDFVLLFDDESRQSSAKSASKTSKTSDINLEFLPESESTLDLAGQVAQFNKPAKKSKKNKTETLSNAELEPLLQGLANSSADISFRSAYALALLKDERALGVLMQLLHTDEVSIRLGIAKAIGELGLPDGKLLLTVLLNDKNAQVRQIAMQSFGRLADNTLQWVSAGFESREQDIHQSALAILLTQANQDEQLSEETIAILTHALNNPFESVRQEVVKVLMNRVLQHNPSQVIALLCQSQSLDVHQLALTEWRAIVQKNQNKETDKDGFILSSLAQFLANPFVEIRNQAFEFADLHEKYISTAILLELAFASPFIDIRTSALMLLKRQKSAKLLPLVAVLFNDESSKLRLDAIKFALEFNPSAQDLDVLRLGLNSLYDDVQLSTAQALAKNGTASDKQQSLAIFEKFLTIPAPNHAQDVPASKGLPKPLLYAPNHAQDVSVWKQNIELALTGLAYLEQGFTWFERYLNDVNHDFSVVADKLFYVIDEDEQIRTEQLNVLAQWQQDSRTNVANGASLALAVFGDKRGEGLLKQKISSTLPRVQWLQACHGLGIENALALQPMFHEQKRAYNLYSLLLCYDALLNPEQPTRLIESLTFVPPHLAVLGAGLIARYHDSEQMWTYLAETLNHAINLARTPNRPKTEKLWALDSQTLQQLASILLFGSAKTKAKAITVLHQIATHNSFEQWQLLWHTLSAEATTLKTATKAKKVEISQIQTWQATAFGVWLGLIRQADYYAQDVALSAITQLHQFAQANPQWTDSVQRTLLPLLNESFYQVRHQAWQTLEKLQLDPVKLGESAMNSPMSDMAELGLTTWLKTLSEEQAVQQLQSLVATSSSEFLSVQAYRQLVKRLGVYPASELALSAYNVQLRKLVLNEWQNHLTDDKVTLLNQALLNDEWSIQRQALQQLLTLDQRAKKPLNAQLIQQGIQLWTSAQTKHEQQSCLALLSEQFSTHTATAELDEQAGHLLTLLDSPERKQDINDIYDILANTRSIRLAPTLLQRLANHQQYVPSQKNKLISTLTIISGFDQVIEDYENESSDKRWLERQFPRHPALLLQLSEQCLQLTEYGTLANLCVDLAWIDEPSLNTQIDEFLYRSLLQLPQQYAVHVVTAMAYRVKYRQGDLKGLKKALTLKDPDIQFYGAEGLAEVGNKDGFSILMATIDYHANGDLRRRAVLALGKLAELQSFEKLIKLAEDSEHYLADVACEAIAHLAEHDQEQRILTLITDYLNNAFEWNSAIKHYINALRWLNTNDSWQAIYDYIRHSLAENPSIFYEGQLHAIHVLKHQDNPATRALLLDILQQQDIDEDAFNSTLNIAQFVFGNEKTQVYTYDWAVLKSDFPLAYEQLSLKRVTQYAPVDELIRFVTDYSSFLAQRDESESDANVVFYLLTQAIFERELSIDDIMGLFAQSQHCGIVEQDLKHSIVVQYLNRHPKHWSAEIEQQLWHLFAHTQQRQQQQLQQLSDKPTLAQNEMWLQQQQRIESILSPLVWLLVRYSDDKANTGTIAKILASIGLGKQQPVLELITWLQAQTQTLVYHAFTSIAECVHVDLKQALLALLARQAEQPLAKEWVNVIATTPHWATAELQQLAEQLLSHAKATVSTEILSPTAQLLTWVKTSDTQALFAWASDAQRDEASRISAIEALGQLVHCADVAQLLQQLQQHDPDSDIQRSAFKALRRYQRQQQKRQTVKV